MKHDIIIKAKDGDDFRAVAGLRIQRARINGHRDDTFAGLMFDPLRRLSVSGRAIFKDASADEFMRVRFFDGKVQSYQIVIPGVGTATGPFQITRLEFGGERNGEVTFDLSLDSAGELTFNTAP